MADTLKVLSPYNLECIEELNFNTEKDVESCLNSADKLFKDRDRWLPPYKRIEILEKLAELMKKNKSQFVELAVKEGGKPFVDTEVEVDRAIQGIKLGAVALHKLHGEQVPMGLTQPSVNRLATTFYEPVGPVVSLSAFNHPLNLIVHQTVPAIAAGCPVIVKPALDTPLSCLKFVRLIHEAGLPESWCQCLVVTNENAEKLACDNRVGYVSFIGSQKVGWYLRSRLAKGTRLALEHGGVAPVIIDKVDNLDDHIPDLIKGAFYHAGQVCVSIQRIYVAEAQLHELVEKLKEKANALKVGDPKEPDCDVGPLIRPQETERVGLWVEEAVKGGAKLACGGKATGETLFEPTILVNPPEDAKVSREEIFGPVVCVYSFKTLDEAIERANSLDYAFQASIFSNNLDRALYSVQRLNASCVMVNDHTAFRVDWMPFGGRDWSGLGLGGIFHSAKEMMREKLMVIKSPSLS